MHHPESAHRLSLKPKIRALKSGLFLLVAAISGCRTAPPIPKTKEVIIIFQKPSNSFCKFIKEFSVTSSGQALADIMRYSRNDAKIKGKNIGANYITIHNSKMNHRRNIGHPEKDKYQFTLHCKAYHCEIPLRRKYLSVEKKTMVSPKEVVILERHVPVVEYCKFIDDAYISGKGLNINRQKAFRSSVKKRLQAQAASLGANLLRSDMTRFNIFTGEYVIYGRLFYCVEKYINFLKKSGY